MNTSTYNVAGFRADIKDEELMAVVKDRKVDNDRQLALKTLLQRKSKMANEVAGEVLNNPFYDRRMKLVAANFLGQTPSEEGLQCLCKQLKYVQNKQLKSRIVRSIGKTGGPEALKELEGIQSKEASFARSLIAYRHNIKAHYLPRVENKAFSKRSKYAEIKPTAITSARKKNLREMAETAGHQSAVLGEYKLPMLKLDCFGTEFYLTRSEATSKKDFAAKMLEAPAIPVKVFMVNDCPREATLAYYIMTHPIPGEQDKIKAHLVTASGRMAYSGELSLKEEYIDMSIGTAEESVFPPTRIKGIYNVRSGAFDFESILSQLKLDATKRKMPRRV